MLSKKMELCKLQKRLKINIFGIEDLKTDQPIIFVANHNCLMDIFYLPASLPIGTVSLISARLIYKTLKERKAMIDNLLYSFPIEAHGGPEYSKMCLNEALKLLQNNISVNIFPEGAYIESSNQIFKGRTGAARILYNAKLSGIKARIVPVAIEINSKQLNLDGYRITDDKINVYILKEIEYYTYFKKYITSSTREEKNIALHSVIDEAMKAIALKLNKEYKNEYIKLYPKNNVMFKDGTTVNVYEAQSQYYLDKYNEELSNRIEDICKNNI